MAHMTEEEFEQAVQDAIDSLPDEFLDDLENVAGGIISEARGLKAVNGNSDNLTNFAAGAI